MDNLQGTTLLHRTWYEKINVSYYSLSNTLAKQQLPPSLTYSKLSTLVKTKIVKWVINFMSETHCRNNGKSVKFIPIPRKCKKLQRKFLAHNNHGNSQKESALLLPHYNLCVILLISLAWLTISYCMRCLFGTYLCHAKNFKGGTVCFF